MTSSAPCAPTPEASSPSTSLERDHRVSVQHLILGAGQVGPEIARQLAAEGESVAIATRSGRDPGIPGVTSVRVDASDPAQVRAAARGVAVTYFACQPAYTNWPKGFPPLVEGVLGGLRGTATRLVVVDNLYMYGPTGGRPITEDLPWAATTRKGAARARMATKFMEAHGAGDVPVAIGRAADFFGAGVIDSSAGERLFGAVAAGKAVQALGDPDAPHSHTYVPDFARALIELGRHDEALGEVWHVPTAEAVSVRRFVAMAAAAAGTTPKVTRVSKPMLHLVGLFVPVLREFPELWYEFAEPFVLDSSKIQRAFGLRPTPLEESVPATVEWYRSRAASSASRKAAGAAA
jgi:nucleoside-diphosphate-sugar epimerase